MEQNFENAGIDNQEILREAQKRVNQQAGEGDDEICGSLNASRLNKAG
jgi:hypothetical protein